MFAHMLQHRRVSWLPYLVSMIAAFAVVYAPWSRLPWNRLPRTAQDAWTIFLGVLLEAIPFLLLGVLVSGLIRRFATPARLQRILPKSILASLPATALLGVAFPVCECGNLPVARQLMRQGVQPFQAVTFLLAAPILNPVVFLSTYAAFRYNPSLVAARFLLGFTVAVLVGWYFAIRYKNGEEMLHQEFTGESHHRHAHGILQAMIEEFFELLPALGVGACIAALVQVVVPREMLMSLAGSPLLSIAVMMLLGLVVSLCSTVDAFFALSFASIFAPSALVAFLVFGPMIDFRALALLSRTFSTSTIFTITLLVAELVFIASLSLHYIGWL